MNESTKCTFNLNSIVSTSPSMVTRTLIAVFVPLFFTPAMSHLAAGEHPEHPRQPLQLPQQATQSQPGTVQTQEVTKAEISAGIKKHIARDEKKSSDRKFHTKYKSKDLALDLVKVH